ncbi:MAG: hypothetical protein Q8859_10750, partial [Bacteroidota bacterium]|nr:hypothetical protein [Bacteroidota bacterium]
MKRYLSTIFSKGIIFITSAILFYATICFPENLFAQNCSLSASADQTICENQPLVLVGQKSGTFYGDGSTTWSQIEGPLVVITSPNSLSTSVTGFSGGNTYTFRLSGKCQDGSLVYDDVKIIVMPYDIATASYIQGKCNTGTFRITGNQPTIGTGLWSIIGDANGATILNPTNPTTSVVGLAIGKSVVLQWKINNGTCPESTSEITLTNWAPPAANAGPDQSNCNNDSFVMNANAVPDYAEGKWSIEGASNGASIDYTDFHNAKAHVSGLEPGKSVTLRWTITAGGCTSNSDDVVLKNDAPPTSADAGPDQMNCGNGTFLLAANAPIIGKGEWSIISEANGATISSIYTPNALVTNLKSGCSVTLRWTIRNGSCDSSSDDVVLTNFGSVTGTDQSNCNNGTFILSANSPTPGSGLWTIVGSAHGAQISNPTSPNATVNGVAAGNRVTLRWTVTNGACSQSSDVVLTNYGMPETITAGPNQTNCNNETFIMAASSAGLAIGTWSIKGSANGAVITELHNPATTVTGLNPGSSVILTWTVANGTCTPQSSDVMLTNYAIPTQANAGPDQINCNSGTFILAGNTPAAGIGKWSFAGSDYGAIIADPTNPTTSVTGVPAGEAITLRWTIANGTCTSSSDEVMLTNKAEAPIANAGINQTQSNSGTFVMNANNSSPGVGTWTIQGSANGATIADIHNPVTTVSGLNPDCQAVLRWTIDNAPCPSTYSEVTLKNDALPTIANAGPDLSNCNNGSFTLGGNTPTVGKGLWTIIGINYGVTIADPSNPVSSVTGLQAGKSVVLRWTISNGISPASYDEVELTNYAPPSNAIAGANQTNCNNGSFTMAANTPASGEGTWSISGPANGTVITDIHNPTTTITGLLSGNSATLVWTISNGVCNSNSASVVLTNLNELPIANAGSDQTNCQSGSFSLNANSVSSPATGTWTFVGAANGAKISNVNDPKATVSGLTEGSSTTLRWTLTNDVCSST